MKNLIRLEEAFMFGLSIYFFSFTNFAWWWFPALILVPDIGMLGYLINTRIGAITYNLFHHKAVAIVFLVAGWQLPNDYLLVAGIILFGHSSLDRLFGYGLKFSDSFKNTHLGKLS